MQWIFLAFTDQVITEGQVSKSVETLNFIRLKPGIVTDSYLRNYVKQLVADWAQLQSCPRCGSEMVDRESGALMPVRSFGVFFPSKVQGGGESGLDRCSLGKTHKELFAQIFRLRIQTMSNDSREVTVVDIKMPFLSMVVFMVKFAIASIPAFIILSIIFSVLSMVFGGMFHAGMGRF